MKREPAELAIPDHHLEICRMFDARAQGRLVEFDTIDAQGKGEPTKTG